MVGSQMQHVVDVSHLTAERDHESSKKERVDSGSAAERRARQGGDGSIMTPLQELALQASLQASAFTEGTSANPKQESDNVDVKQELAQNTLHQSYFRNSRPNYSVAPLQSARDGVLEMVQTSPQQDPNGKGVQSKGTKPLSRRKNKKPMFWTPEDHEKFLQGLDKFGMKDHLGPGGAELLSLFMGNRSVLQVKSHAQKYFHDMASRPTAGQ